jgi:lysyl-tRNA synthetase class I
MSLSNEDIKQLIAILQKGLSTNEPEEIDSSVPLTEEKKEVETNSNIHSPNRRKKQKVKLAKTDTESYNKFDKMPEKSMHKDDARIDKILSKYAPTTRTREFNLINVTCRVCGKKDEINPALIYDSGSRYKCNRCSTTSG